MPKSRSDDIKENMEVVYTFIRSFIQEHNYSPSMQEIADSCYMARASVVRYVDKLEAKGRLKRDLGVARSIALTDN